MASSAWTVRNTFVHFESEEAIEGIPVDAQPSVLRSKTAPLMFPNITDSEDSKSGEETETPELSEQASSVASDVEWLPVDEIRVVPRKGKNAGLPRKVSWAPEMIPEAELTDESLEESSAPPGLVRRNRRSVTWHAEVGMPAYVLPASAAGNEPTRSGIHSPSTPARVEPSGRDSRRPRRAVTWHPTFAEDAEMIDLQALMEGFAAQDRFCVDDFQCGAAEDDGASSVGDDCQEEEGEEMEVEASPQPNLLRMITKDSFEATPQAFRQRTPLEALLGAKERFQDEEIPEEVRSESGDEQEVVQPAYEQIMANANVWNPNGLVMLQPWFFPQMAPQMAAWPLQVAAAHPAQMNCFAAQLAAQPAVNVAPPGNASASQPSRPQQGTAATSASQPSRPQKGASGSNGRRTTVMMRNLPNNYTRTEVMELLDREGFACKYDFVYFPIDFETHAALGYAFVNLVTPEVAEQFRKVFEGFSNWAVRSGKVCSVVWTQQEQGLMAHVQRYRNSPLMHELVPDEYRPVVLENGRRVPFPEPTKKIKPPRKGTKLMLV